MKKALFVCLAAVIGLAGSAAAADSYSIDQVHSDVSINLEVKKE
jgi:hypothetical protein